MSMAPETSKSGAADGQGRELHDFIYFLACSLIIVLFAWAAPPSSRRLSHFEAKGSYYNLLVQGLRAGQLNLKVTAPPELVQLADPLATNAVYPGDVYGMSYYKEKLYIYWGVTPALTLLWPYASLTGHYLSDKWAVIIFFAIGLLTAAWLLRAIGTHCFPEANSWVMAGAVSAMGLAVCMLVILSFWCDVNAVAEVSGFTFTMLALAAIWQSLKEPERPPNWLLCASLAYGLALGARPSLLYGAIILLAPVAQAWRARAGSHRRVGLLFAAAVGPVTLVGLGLMLYNFRRFDNPFEFGWRYELQDAYRSNAARPFGLAYLWFNFWFYFLQGVHWCGHFPFLQLAPQLSGPAGNVGVGKSYGGILLLTPAVWLALATPLAWKKACRDMDSALRWFLVALISLYAIGLLTMCLFFAVTSRYALEFLPALLLVSLIGLLAVECAPPGSGPWHRAVRPICRLLLVASIVFNLLAMIEAYAEGEYFLSNLVVNRGQPNEAIPYYRRALAVEPKSVAFHTGLATAYYRAWRLNEAIAEFHETLKIAPTVLEEEEIRYYLACCLLAEGHADEVIIQFQKVSQLKPSAEAYSGLGDCYSYLGRQTDAIAHYQRSLAVNPAFTLAENNLGLSLFRAGRVNDAIMHYEKATKLQPQFVEAYYNLGCAFRQNGMATNAVACFEKALALQPNFEMAQVSLAWMLATWPDSSVRNATQAVTVAEHASQLTRHQDSRVLRTLAAAYAESGRFADATSAANQALALATVQANAALTNELQAEIVLYQSKSPCRSTNN